MVRESKGGDPCGGDGDSVATTLEADGDATLTGTFAAGFDDPTTSGDGADNRVTLTEFPVR